MLELQKQFLKALTLLQKKQVDILNTAITSAKDATADLSAGKPQDTAVKSIELTKKSIEDAQANVSDLVKIYEKTATETFEILNKRTLDSLSELKTVVADNNNKVSAPASSAKK